MGSSEFLSVDEGAIAILSMDEIRNMKKLEMDYKIEDLETRQNQENSGFEDLLDIKPTTTPQTPRTSTHNYIQYEGTNGQQPSIEQTLMNKLQELEMVGNGNCKSPKGTGMHHSEESQDGDIGSTKDDFLC